MPMYRRKPVVVVEAKQLTPTNVGELQKWVVAMGSTATVTEGGKLGVGLTMLGLGADESTVMSLRVNQNDYVVLGNDGKFRAHSSVVFAQLYEVAPDLEGKAAQVFIQTPDSGNVASFRYVLATRRLQVIFKNGGCYDYLDVPPALVDRMQGAASVGRFLNQEIKNKFHFEKVE